MSCGILVPWSGTEPKSPAVELWIPNHWTRRQIHTKGHSINTWLIILKTVKSSKEPKVIWWLNIRWNFGWDPGQKKTLGKNSGNHKIWTLVSNYISIIGSLVVTNVPYTNVSVNNMGNWVSGIPEPSILTLQFSCKPKAILE